MNGSINKYELVRDGRKGEMMVTLSLHKFYFTLTVMLAEMLFAKPIKLLVDPADEH